MSFDDEISQLIEEKKYIFDCGDSVLHYILANNTDETANEYLVKTLPLLPQELIDYQNKNSLTALLYACYKGYYNCIKTLIGHNADVNIQFKNKSGRTHPVAYVLKKFAFDEEKQIELLKLFVSHGLCPYDLDGDGNSLLHLAAYENNELFKTAFEYQKNHNIMNRHNESPLDIYFCFRSDLEDLLWLLKNTRKHLSVTKGMRNTPCHYLAAKGNKPVLGYFCRVFPEMNKPNARKFKPRETLGNHSN